MDGEDQCELRDMGATNVYLREHCIGDAEAIALAGVLDRMARTSLVLPKNSIGAEGTTALAEALATNATLLRLDTISVIWALLRWLASWRPTRR